MLVPGIYRHFKGGMYRVFGIAAHSETQEPLVLYQALYGERGLWARPLVMFAQSVEHEGERVPRFACVGPETPQTDTLMDALARSFDAAAD